jgi:transcriptional regulator with XRE-family HTH domain
MSRSRAQGRGSLRGISVVVGQLVEAGGADRDTPRVRSGIPLGCKYAVVSLHTPLKLLKSSVMDIHNQLSDEAVLTEIGLRLTRLRLDRNLTQGEVATEAGVSRDTVQRLERGQSVTLSGLLRVLRALGLIEGLDALIPAPLASPIEQLERASGQRQRASGTSGGRRGEEPRGWRWGTE